MATQTKTVEVQGVSGQTTGFAAKRNDDATGTASSVTLVERAGTGIYTVSVNWDDVSAANETLGDWAISVGSATGYLGRSNVTFESGVDDYRIGVDGGGSGTGARTVTPTVLVSGSPLQNATIRFTLGAETYSGVTNASGQKVFNLDDGTYTVSITKPGYLFAGATLVVDGTETPSYTVTANSIAIPANPALATLSVLCVDELGAPEEGVTIYAKISRIPDGGTGYAYDGTVQDAVSDGDGVASLTVIRLATYLIKRGTSKEWTTVVIANAATTEVKSFVGSP